jgi:hypothetical protein
VVKGLGKGNLEELKGGSSKLEVGR